MLHGFVLNIIVIAVMTTVASCRLETPRRSATIPDQVIVGYANWNQCDRRLVEAVKQGVNVLIWFAINLAVDPITLQPQITNGPDLTCVREIIAEIDELGLSTVHLISIGGWNSPHPDTSVSVGDMFQAWESWSGGIFDGIDWDIEGNDDMSSPFNHFTVECLDFMGQFSRLVKQAGYIVTMAPAESYLDPTTNLFDLDLTHAYPEWSELQPDFKYHGHNTYAYLLENFGETTMQSTGPSFVVPTFDFVTVQLYEGYSHAIYNISYLKQPAVDYIVSFVKSIVHGWHISTLSKSRFSVPSTRLVVGVANGWADGAKFLFIPPDKLGAAYETLAVAGFPIRGFAYWNIADDGLVPVNSSFDVPLYMAKELNAFLKTR